MKKLVILAVAAMLGAVSVQAQGYITLANATATAITNTVTGARATGLSVAAYFSTDSADSSLSGTAFRDKISNSGAPLSDMVGAGIIRSKAVGFTGTSAGDTIVVQLRAWSSTQATFEAAGKSGDASVLWGWSQPFTVKLGASTSPALISGLWGPFTVSPVPEPSVLLLGALGLLGACLIRRK